jgi:hypothetical protein
MRRFFRFTIRDLLWLTLVAALALGWGVREWEFRAKTERANDRLNQWRLALGGLASTMKLQGWTVRLDFESRQAQILDEKETHFTGPRSESIWSDLVVYLLVIRPHLRSSRLKTLSNSTKRYRLQKKP